MDFPRFETQLRAGADACSVPIDAVQAERLYRYFLELRRWSRKVNLISRSAGDEEIVENHFIDSVALLAVLGDGPLFDIGSGAGFPGLVCKAVRDDMAVTLVEPRLKRVSFLRHVIRSLGLAGVPVHGGRLEDGVELPGEEGCAWVVSRAVADVADFLQLCERFRRCGAKVVCMKGPRWPEEFDETRLAADGWSLAAVHPYRLPRSGAQRALLVFQGTAAGDGQ